MWSKYNDMDSINSIMIEIHAKLKKFHIRRNYVSKLSLQEYINFLMNLKLTWGKEYEYLDKFKY